MSVKSSTYVHCYNNADYKKSRCVCETLHVCPRRQQSPKSYIQLQDQNQGHKVIDLDVIWMGVISWVYMHALYEVSIAYGSRVIAKVKVDNRQTQSMPITSVRRSWPMQIKKKVGPVKISLYVMIKLLKMTDVS